MTERPDSAPQVRLLAPREVHAGRPVEFVLRATNETDRPLDLYLRGRTIAFDVQVAAADGRAVWGRLEGASIPAIVQLRTLAPGEALELRATWDQRDDAGRPVAPGRYLARAALLTDLAPLETPPVALHVVPR